MVKYVKIKKGIEQKKKRAKKKSKNKYKPLQQCLWTEPSLNICSSIYIYINTHTHTLFPFVKNLSAPGFDTSLHSPRYLLLLVYGFGEGGDPVFWPPSQKSIRH